MSKFKDELNKELSFLQSDMTVDDIIKKAEKTKKVISFKKATLIAASFLLVLTMIFMPFQDTKSSFVIIANAEATPDSATPDQGGITGDELNKESFVEIKSDEPNFIEYNFNYVLDETADTTNVAQKYLFYSFNKEMKIAIEGNDIDTVTYRISNGSLGCCVKNNSNTNGIDIISSDNPNEHYMTNFTIGYNEYEYISFAFEPLKRSFLKENRYNLLSTGELTNKGVELTSEVLTSGDYIKPIATGVKENKSLATKREIEKLKEFAKNDDMVGFYNYQNQIFKRLIDGITLDITITKTDGKKETQTLEFLYTPDEITEETLNANSDFKGSFLYTMLTPSTGTLSARIKK